MISASTWFAPPPTGGRGRPRRRGAVASVLAGALLAVAGLAPHASAQQPAPAPNVPGRPLAAPAPGAQQALGQPGARAARPLSLADALALAGRNAESLRIAEAAVQRARGQFAQARAQGLPQLNATAAYQKQLQNQFQAIQRANPAPVVPDTAPASSLCTPLIRANATPEERTAALARAQTCGQGADGLGGITRIFANPNNVILGLSGSQLLYAGGRVQAARGAAEAGRRAAEIGLTSARAQVQLDVATAYYDAALADRLVQIAESSLVQTERAYRQTALAREQGTASEFDLLRSRVARDNQRPQLAQARGTREAAQLRLRQLLVLPLDEPLQLTTALPVAAGASDAELARASAEPQAAARGETGAMARRDTVARTVTGRGDTVRVREVAVDPAEVLGEDVRVVQAVATAVAGTDTSGRARATARQSRENVQAQENLLRVSRAQRLPALQLSTNYQRFAYPEGSGVTFPTALNQFFPNWSVTLGASVPLLTGGRIRGDILIAEANLKEAQATARQVEQLAALDARLAITQLEQAEAAFVASSGTAEQAARAYGIAEVRFREGLATQVDLADARLLLQQAQANAAQAARDREVARLRLQLLPQLPLSQVQGGAQAGAGSLGGRVGGGAGQQSVPGQGGAAAGTGAAGGFGGQTGAAGGAAGAAGGAAGGAGQAGAGGTP